METLGNWVYVCGGEELQVEKIGRNSYWQPRIFLSCGGDDDDDHFICRLLKALLHIVASWCYYVIEA
jgi:hypothetical protein